MIGTMGVLRRSLRGTPPKRLFTTAKTAFASPVPGSTQGSAPGSAPGGARGAAPDTVPTSAPGVHGTDPTGTPSASTPDPIAMAPEGSRDGSGRTQGKAKSRHALMYREIIPPVLRVLAYSTLTYFTLHLTWQWLERNETGRAQQSSIEALKNEVRQKVEEKKR